MFRLALMKVYLHREPIDFRAGINSLAVLVQEVMELDPFAPSAFAFCNRRRDRVKLLFFDRSTSTETSNIKSICQTKITNLFSLRLHQQAPKY
ncbi:IS66 family insertion sequence element accessory protein TnpB [Agrobacterium pusense]|uniref:IS66 family insertion sequence element accessory protein TnpB n=1 Tax=Agrobacterium pusense TaxID=648995 RepID=UPI0035A6E62C